MKITQLKGIECSPALTTINTDILTENIRTGTKSKPVSAFREQLKYALPGEHCNAVERLPKILSAAEFKKDGDGILMNTINPVPLRYLTQRTATEPVLASLLRPGCDVPPQLRIILPGTARRNAR